MNIKIPEEHDAILFVDDEYAVIVGLRDNDLPFWVGEEYYPDEGDLFVTTGLYLAKSFRNEDGVLCLKLIEDIEVE